MARDYVVNITGRDNLSATLKGVKQQLQDTTSSASGLDKIEQRFERIQNSTAPLKRKLRELQGIMDKMNLDGLANTDVFTRMAAEAASYKDAIGDTAQAVRLLSSDTATLDAGIEAFQGLAGAASIATGVMGMLGSENEDVQKAILKVQSAIGILNGVQAIANTLNKDSILMLKLKQFWESANAKTTVVATTATTANTVVTNANRIATQAWNTVKAISKALLGDFTGLILVGAGALATYAMFTDDSTEADKKNADALKDQKSEAESLADTLSKKLGTETANLTGKYLALRDGWKNCRNEHEKNEFITNNATAFKSLGLNITDVSSAENAFVANTNSVVQALNARAEAAAYAAIQQELYEKAIRQEASVKQQKQKVTTNTRNINNQRARAVGNTKYHDTNNYTTAGIQAQEAEARETRKQAEEMGRKSAEAARKATQLSKKSGAFGSVNTQKTGGKATRTNRTTGTTNNTKEQPVFKEDAVTIEDMTNNVNILTSKLKKLDPNTAEFEEVSKYLSSWKDKLSAVDKKLKKTEVKPKFEKGSIADYQDQIAAINEQLQNQNLSMDVRLNLLTDKENLENQAQELINPLKAKEEAEKAAEEAEKERAKQQEERKSKQIEGYQAIGDAASAMGQLMSAAGAEGAAAAMQIVATTANATAQMIPQIMALIGAKEGEAMANGTASAAALPFPANIAAIASIIATVVGTFASIFSTVGAFAGGGIIQGASTHGDQLLARVNAGEMILNGSQQARLFNLLDGAGAVGGVGMGQVSFKIKGSDLYGSLSNYSKIKAKSGLKTGIK